MKHESEITVRLPLGDESAAAQGQPGPAAAEPPSYRVLVIDDSRDAAFLLQKLLLRLGHQVEVADDGRSGIEAVRKFRPEVVLCDIGMPGGMDGYQVAEALRADEALQGLYLVAVTGYAQEDDLRRAAAAGFDQHVTKPVGLEALKTLLDGISRR